MSLQKIVVDFLIIYIHQILLKLTKFWINMLLKLFKFTKFWLMLLELFLCFWMLQRRLQQLMWVSFVLLLLAPIFSIKRVPVITNPSCYFSGKSGTHGITDFQNCSLILNIFIFFFQFFSIQLMNYVLVYLM